MEKGIQGKEQQMLREEKLVWALQRVGAEGQG